MDRFEIHLRNLFAQAFGQNFTAGKLKIAFPEVAGVEICQIDVSPVDSAIIVSGKDKNGVGYERLYVRSGNSPPEMPLSGRSQKFSRGRKNCGLMPLNMAAFYWKDPRFSIGKGL